MARRLFKIVLVLAAFLGVVWSGLWFGASWVVKNALADQGRSSGGAACKDPAIAGFPVRFEVTCRELTLNQPSRGVSFGLPGVTATALLLPPGRLMASAVGPVKLRAGPLQLVADAGWSSAAARADVGFSGLSGFAAQLETGRLVLDTTVGLPPIHVVEFRRGRIELGPSPTDSGSLTFTASLESLRMARPNGKGLPEVNVAVSATAKDLGAVGPGVASWSRREGGGPIQIERAEIAYGETKIRLSGDLTLAPSGQMSGKLKVQVNDIDGLFAIADDVAPGWRQSAEKALAAMALRAPSFVPVPKNLDQLLSLVRVSFRDANTPEGPTHEMDLIISNGTVRYGIIPLPISIPALPI